MIYWHFLYNFIHMDYFELLSVIKYLCNGNSKLSKNINSSCLTFTPTKIYTWALNISCYLTTFWWLVSKYDNNYNVKDVYANTNWTLISGKVLVIVCLIVPKQKKTHGHSRLKLYTCYHICTFGLQNFN